MIWVWGDYRSDKLLMAPDEAASLKYRMGYINLKAPF